MSLLAGSYLSFLSSPPLPLFLLSTSKPLHARLITTGIIHSPTPPSPLLWNSLINSLDPFPAILTFALMLYHGLSVPDEFSFSLAIRACSRSRSFAPGSQIHTLVHKSGLLASSVYLHNSLIAFYSRCGQPEAARRIFDRAPERDVVSWNSMIDGYVKSGELSRARGLFDGMGDEERNVVTWNSMLGGYTSRGEDGIDDGRELFDRIPEQDPVSWNLMIGGYAKCRRLDEAEDLFGRMPGKDVVSWANLIAGYAEVGRIGSARRLFDEMPSRDVVAWNVMITGYVKNGRFATALRLFSRMREDGNVSPDGATLAAALSAVSELGRVRDGIAIHEFVERNRMPLDGKLGVALIDMYSKCGRLEDALRVFEASRSSVDHWNAMIGGLAIHGYGRLALRLFREMERLSLRPDDITFIGILSACSHAGMVKEGLACFEMMRREYGLEPKVQHYGCMVDVLSRAGRLDEAWELIRAMPTEPNDVIWKSLLSGCRERGNVDMGLKVANVLLKGSTATSSGSHVLLSNIYAGVGMWGDARNVRTMMQERDLGKVPGCSWIEIDGSIHEFLVGDSSHPQAEQVYSTLQDFFCVSKMYDKHSLCSV
ncbi:pentatricopeptide repeat-containing protein, chloroplastic [Iris pallida]|uniref:Pentatricopeptide repeat-containing protein, chloroplastic n=1 Tax=Iris pallida TaxID=29817 RepID=A0AAX6H5Y8_IRIPA|nr:pentatricopeptide repeat-containing protein, chloroplastic [Iris pallida]